MSKKKQKKEDAKHQRNSLIIGIIMSSLFLIIIIITILLGWRFAESQKAIENWPSTSSDIISSEIETNIIAKNRWSKTVHELIISYRYYIDGNEYISSNYNSEGTLKSESYNLLEKTRQKYAVGSKVEAFYDPLKPQMSVLSKDITNSNLYIVLAIEFIILIVSVLIVILNIKGKSKKK